jgi:hypothetical protein
MVFTLIQFGQSLSVSVSRGISSHWPIEINLKMNKVNSKMYAVEFISQTFLGSNASTLEPHDPTRCGPRNDVLMGRLRETVMWMHQMN